MVFGIIFGNFGQIKNPLPIIAAYIKICIDTFGTFFQNVNNTLLFRSVTDILILVNAYIAFKMIESVKSAKSAMSFIYIRLSSALKSLVIS